MRSRLARSAPLVLAACLFAACSGSGTATPSTGATTAPPNGLATAPSTMAPGSTDSGDAMTALCQTWTTDVAPSWPPDTATAARLAPMVKAWAQAPALATVSADLTTLSTWLSSQVTSTTAPDASTTAAFTRIGQFVTANCS